MQPCWIFLTGKQARIAAIAFFLLPCQICFLRAQDGKGGGDDAAVPGWRYEFQRKYELFRDYGYDWRLAGSFGVNAEDGLILAAGPILYNFGFRTFPYVYRMELKGGVSLPTLRFKVDYNGFWPVLSERLSLDIRAHASELELRNFYGFGNDAGRDEEKESASFYRVSSGEVLAQPRLLYRLFRGASFGVGASVKYFKVRQEEDRFLSASTVALYGDNRTLGSLGVSFLFGARDHPTAPHRGIFAGVEGWNYLEVFGNQKPFQKYNAEVKAYLGDTVLTDIMAAFRVRGELLEGEFPFYEAAFLGGAGSLRGFPSQRFAGDASLFGSVELRFSIGRWFLIVPTEVGLFVLADAGRVWVDGDSPGPLHSDWGGGLWVAPLDRGTILSVALASSVEGLFVSGGVGFAF